MYLQQEAGTAHCAARQMGDDGMNRRRWLMMIAVGGASFIVLCLYYAHSVLFLFPRSYAATYTYPDDIVFLGRFGPGYQGRRTFEGFYEVQCSHIASPANHSLVFSYGGRSSPIGQVTRELLLGWGGYETPGHNSVSFTLQLCDQQGRTCSFNAVFGFGPNGEPSSFQAFFRRFGYSDTLIDKCPFRLSLLGKSASISLPASEEDLVAAFGKPLTSESQVTRE